MKEFESDPLQEAAIIHMSETDSGAALNGSGTGAGKTMIAVQAAINRGVKRALIIAPPNTFENWEATLKSLSGDTLHLCANAKAAGFTAKVAQENMARAQAGQEGWFFVGREMFNRQSWKKKLRRNGDPYLTAKGKAVMVKTDVWDKRAPYDLAVFDEVQMCSNRDSRTRQSWAGLDASFKIAQSADWFGSDLTNMHTVSEDLWPGFTGQNRTEWIDEYMLTEFDPFSFNKKRVTGEQWPGFFASTLPCYVAIPSPVDKPVPERRYVDLSPKQAKLYQELNEKMAAEIDGNLLVVEMDMHLTMRLRELTLGLFHPVDTVRKNKDGEMEPYTTVDFRPGDESSTIDEIKAIMRDYPGEAMLVLTHSQKFAEKAAIDLGGLPYTGKQSLAEKKEAERAFKAGEVKVLVGTDSITEGLDGLQEVCRLSVIASRLWVGYKNDQFLGRTARRGQKREVVAYEIVRRNTLDVGVISRILQKTLDNNAAKAMQKKEEKK